MKGGCVLGYTGSVQDAVTGGYALGNGYRMALPALMRFNAPDTDSPFGPGGVNGYAYCADDPVNGSDPSGHMMWGAAMLRDAEDALEQTVARAADPSELLNANGPGGDIAGTSGQRRKSAEWVGRFFDELDDPGHAAAPAAPARAPVAAPLALEQAVGAGRGNRDPAALGAVVGVVGQTVHLRYIPVSDADVQEFFRAAYAARLVNINPDGQAVSRVLYEIEPSIAMNGVPVNRNDPMVVSLMKRLGATRGPGAPYAGRYIVKLRAPANRAEALDVLFMGTVPGAPDFKSIVMTPKPGGKYTHTLFEQAFLQQAKHMRKRVAWNAAETRAQFY
ncbi:RHS repeat-associated core domain-containing protein [Bordetella bronchialis]|uniref:RHS repeat-associated core domain-containing protein n=2 Tax=Bordetella bronchialis TaxID=463025 RepID=A0A193FLP8_9BORD|nr:hypothetical protein BAU06_21850 [Bordetella bronchialis]ANN73738.1 hypothetical protein BAU08_22380 [Bordetella bronchialis]